MEWIKQLFGTEKPIIAMCHLRPMPGDPYYDKDGGMRKVVDEAYREFTALQEGGVDAVMFSNEFSMPYLKKVNPETTASMARVIGELMHEIKIPFGVNVLWDPFASDFGLWDTNTGEIARHRVRLGLEDCKLLFNIVPEAAQYLAPREVSDIAKTTVFNNSPDVICVSGMTAGVGTDMGVLARVKNAIPDCPVFANTGCRINTIEEIFKIADGAVVGTTFKKDGKFENNVEKSRVVAFMDKVHSIR